MTAKQQRFCEEYLVDGNATQAALRAGYSKKTAYSIGNENLKKPEIADYIAEKMEELSGKTIADAEEVLAYLTSVLRGESQSEIVVVEGQGEGVSSATHVIKAPDERDRLRAAELLGKRHGLFRDMLQLASAIPVVIQDDLGEEEVSAMGKIGFQDDP